MLLRFGKAQPKILALLTMTISLVNMICTGISGITGIPIASFWYNPVPSSILLRHKWVTFSPNELIEIRGCSRLCVRLHLRLSQP